MKLVNDLVRDHINALYDDLEVMSDKTVEAYEFYLNRQNEEMAVEAEIVKLKAYLDSQGVSYIRRQS